jgi:hypothetical protein
MSLPSDNTPGQRLVLALITNEISNEEFIDSYINNNNNITEDASEESIITDSLQKSIGETDKKDLECAHYIGFHFKFSQSHEPLLLEALTAPWHERHQEVVRAIVSLLSSGEGIQDIGGVSQGIYDCCVANWEYLKEEKEDDGWSLENDCIHALGKLAKTDNSGQALTMLNQLTKSDVDHIADKANYIIKKYKLEK